MTEAAFAQQVTELARKLFRRQKLVHETVGTSQGTPQPRAATVAPSPPVIPQAVVVSKLQLIGLGRVRSSLGDRWPKLADRVRHIAQGIIAKNLVPGDVCESCGDDGFLVLLVQLSPADARFKSDAICRQIERHLIGANLAEVSACSAEVVTINPDEVRFDESEDKQGVQPGAGVDASSAVPARLRGQTDFPHRPPPSNRHEDIASNRSAEKAASPGDASRRPEGANPPPAERPSIVLTQSDDAAAHEDRPVRARRHTDLDWLYRPVWDYQHSSLIMFALHPSELNGSAAFSAGVEFIADRDTAAVWKCVNDLSALSASGRRLPILAELHHGTIENARRRAFFSGTVKNIPPECRKLITFEIVGCPQGGLNFGICGFVAVLRASGLRVAMRVNPHWPDFLAVERSGVQIVTMDAIDLNVPEAEKMIAFEIFAARAGNAKLDSAVWGLGTRSMVVAAASAGIRYLAGSPIAPDATGLSRALRFSPVDLYQHS